VTCEGLHQFHLPGSHTASVPIEVITCSDQLEEIQPYFRDQAFLRVEGCLVAYYVDSSVQLVDV